MECNRYMVKAKARMNKEWVTGYYYKMSETTHCPIGEVSPVPVHHYVLVKSMTDWGLPNQMLRYEIDPDTICICTGLKDKNGKYIFEHDIMKGFLYPYLSDGNHNYYGLCDWFENVKAFMIYTIKNPDAKISGISHGNTEFMEYWNPEMWEIIGNEFDNPELLGE